MTSHPNLSLFFKAGVKSVLHQLLSSVSCDETGKVAFQRGRNSNPFVDVHQKFPSAALRCTSYSSSFLHLWRCWNASKLEKKKTAITLTPLTSGIIQMEKVFIVQVPLLNIDFINV